MEIKRTLFEYLYENLKEQILNGYLQYGEKLPSMSQISEVYHVGIRTVREVLHALKAEGLILTEERRPAVVIYRLPEEEKKEWVVKAVLERKESILEVYETMYLLMPILFAFSASVCSIETLERCFCQLRKSSRKPLAVRWKASASALHALLDASGNRIFRDVFTSLELGARVPFFLEHRKAESFTDSYEIYKDPMWMYEAVRTENPEEIRRRFRTMYRSVADDVKMYLNEISGKASSPVIYKKECYSWNAERSRDQYYMQIARDLIDRIGLGEYKDGTFLPSEKVLADRYGVSVSTIRRAISLLNKTGFCRTYNVKGTQVTLFNHTATQQCMKDKERKEDTLIYLSGLQLMAIAVRPAACIAAERILQGELEEIQEKVQRSETIPLAVLIRVIIDHIPLKPYKIILKEVSEILHWGYYFSFFSEGARGGNKLNNMSLEAFEYLRSGRNEEFGDQMSLCYSHILEMVRDHIVNYGLPEAGRLAVPDLNIFQ
ncbi:GntR family transcriptional regulator [Clostridium sp. AM58-1XD]|uniref:GntR family transcriptional regulator n=1 Tax=Clostridium sp. AM58-1XD TaxID=2292307 RepID=UPI000E475953|nr:GntR family transcriptional regulator [Clostridium sp. AM58-1XD]RGY98901.1 GntR family transcriptional regulator [Clostridium sp. AM58-1XD]